MKLPTILMATTALVAALHAAPALAGAEVDETAILAVIDAHAPPVTASEDDDLPAYLTDSPADETDTLTLTLVDDAAL